MKQDLLHLGHLAFCHTVCLKLDMTVMHYKVVKSKQARQKSFCYQNGNIQFEIIKRHSIKNPGRP